MSNVRVALHPWTDRLLRWLAKPSTPRGVELAHKLGVSMITIHNWRHGALPMQERADRVEKLSGGYVKASLAVRPRKAA